MPEALVIGRAPMLCNKKKIIKTITYKGFWLGMAWHTACFINGKVVGFYFRRLKLLMKKMEKLMEKRNKKFGNKRPFLAASVLFVHTLVSAFPQTPSTTVSKSWGLNGPVGVDAPKAWTQIAGGDCSKSSVVVAVIDTGIDMNHPELKGSLWKNPKEISGKSGLDDDKNGFVDDLHGWDFVSKKGILVDQHGHGTHIAGIISATGQGDSGLKGVCPGAKIMSLRYYNERASGAENLKNTIAAIEYAVANGAHIINYSGGGAEFARAEFLALKQAEEKGILVVAAAGNERSNADVNYYFPAAYDLGNIISVTAIDSKGEVLPSSNWGLKKVHLAAPGQSILSTLPGGEYGLMTGTSQATAFVTGIAALLRTKNRSLSMRRLKEIIQLSALKRPSLIGKAQSGASANADAALKYLNNPNYLKTKSLLSQTSGSGKKAARSYSSTATVGNIEPQVIRWGTSSK